MKLTPLQKGDAGLLCCLPLQSNVPDADKRHADWRLVTCPRCGRKCWESKYARMAMEAGAFGVCTECALKA